MSTTDDDDMWGSMNELDYNEVDEMLQAASPIKSPVRLDSNGIDSPPARIPAAVKRPTGRTYRDRSRSTDRVSRHSAVSKLPKPLKIPKTPPPNERISSPSKMTLSPVKMLPDEMQIEEKEVIAMVDTDTESSDVSTRHSSLSLFDSRTTSMKHMGSGAPGPSQTSVASPRKLDSMCPSRSDLKPGSSTKPWRINLDYPESLDFYDLPNKRSPTKLKQTVPDDPENLNLPASPDQPSPRKLRRTALSPLRSPDKLERLNLPGSKPSAGTRSGAVLPSSPVRACTTPFADRSPIPGRSEAFVQGPSSRIPAATPTRPPSPEKHSARKPAVRQNIARSYTTGDIPRHNGPLVPASSVSGPTSDNELDGTIRKVFGGQSMALEQVIIVHSSEHQRELEQLSWGVQYELARGITCGQWTWDKLTTAKLRQLVGPNVETAHKVVPVMRGRSVPERKPSASAIWREMDREQSAIMENVGRGLGLMGDYDDRPNWYGGKIQQVARLRKAEKDGDLPYVIFLDKVEMRRSNRAARFLGSRRLLALHVPDKLLSAEGDEIRAFLQRKFIILGRTFIPLHAKDEKLYMVETSEDYEREPNPQQGDDNRLSFDELLRLFNPLALNAKQPISKWDTRLALSFSTSVPVLNFDPQHIRFIDDEFATGVDKASATTEQTMTDGCGFVNAAALLGIQRQMGYNNSPTAIQGRIAGSKGLWILHPDPEHRKPNDPPRIWIRASQKKISLTEKMVSFPDTKLPQPDLSTVHRMHLIFDLVCPNRFLRPARLSMQTVLNMHHNGVPTELLVNLMVEGLREDVAKLTDLDQKTPMLLIDAIDKAGRVTGAKLQRLAGDMSRALGFSGREFRQDVDDEDPLEGFDDDEADSPDVDHAFDPCLPPVSLHELAVELLKAGFHPLKLNFLFVKIREIVGRKIDAVTRGFHIPIPFSADVFIVPDPLGILNEGEVYFRSSQGFGDTSVSRTLESPVLLNRNPTRVASDVQKVLAVDRPELTQYSDVLVASIKGKRSLASCLAGGDYDGDTVMVVWDPRFVKPFQNAQLSVPGPDFIEKNFNRDIERVPQFIDRTDRLSRSEAHSALLRVLLQGMADRKVGIYSRYHDIAVHQLGLTNPETERLAHMFTHLLDSDKTGLRAKDEVVTADKKRFNTAMPDCMKKEGESDHEEYGYKAKLPRKEELGPCILCTLMQAGKTERDQLLSEYEKKGRELRDHDKDVLAPWEDANQRAASNAAGADLLRSDIDIVKRHVEEARKAWPNAFKETSNQSKSPKKKMGKKTNVESESKSVEDRIKDVAKQYHEMPPGLSVITSEHEVARWKAGFALTLGSSFAFKVAFWNICGIKAEAKGRSTSTGVIASLSTIPSSVLRVLQPADDN